MHTSDKNTFYKSLFVKHLEAQDMPSNKRIAQWADNILYLLFPERNANDFKNVDQLEEAFQKSEAELFEILIKTKACSECNNEVIADQFYKKLPDLYRIMLTDAQAIIDGDPAAISIREVIRTYPGFTALCIYRIAHDLWLSQVPLIPRILTECTFQNRN